MRLTYGWGCKSIERPMTHQERTQRARDQSLALSLSSNQDVHGRGNFFFPAECRRAGNDGQFE